MYGRLPRNGNTGEAYMLPSLDRIQTVLLEGGKSTKQIVDELFPSAVDFRDLLCALAIMYNSKLVSEQMLKVIREREDELAQYVNFITGEMVYRDGELITEDLFQSQTFTRHLSKSFRSYVEFCDQSSRRVASSLISKLKYFQKCKVSFEPKVRAEMERDPEFAYFVTCQQQMELAMPVLEKVFDKTLCLYDYSLTEIQINALKYAANFFNDYIKRLLFDNCGTSDQQFAVIL